MTKETIFNLFKKHNGENFTISTNCAVGKGINGVDYTTYMGQRELIPSHSYDPEIYEESEIVAIEDGYIELHNTYTKYTKNKGYWCESDTNIIIPFETITAISFLNEGCANSWMKREKYIEECKLFD